MKIFSQEKVNLRRQPEIDIAKGLAIVFMVWCHVFVVLTPNSWNIPILIVDGILGGPFAAPVFMMCLGVGICYSKKNTAPDLLKRGFILLGIGIMLNVVRMILPDLIRSAIYHDIEYATYSLFYSFFSIDILQFAGLAFIFLALLKRLKLNNYFLAAVGALLSLLGTFLRQKPTGNFMADSFLGCLWGTNQESYFPLFNWIIFPIAGLIFGSFLLRCKDKRKLYLWLSPICGGLLVIYIIFILPDQRWHESDPQYYFLGTVDAIAFVALTITCFGLYYAMTQLLPKVSFKTLTRLSKHITAIYCIHWFFLGTLSLILRDTQDIYYLLFWQGTLIAAALLIVSDRLAVLYYAKFKSKQSKQKIS